MWTSVTDGRPAAEAFPSCPPLACSGRWLAFAAVEAVPSSSVNKPENNSLIRLKMTFFEEEVGVAVLPPPPPPAVFEEGVEEASAFQKKTEPREEEREGEAGAGGGSRERGWGETIVVRWSYDTRCFPCCCGGGWRW